MLNYSKSARDLTADKLMTIIDSISDGVLAIDLEMRVTFLNLAAEKITGADAGDVIGRQCREVFRTDVCEKDCALRQTFRTGNPVINKYICGSSG